MKLFKEDIILPKVRETYPKEGKTIPSKSGIQGICNNPVTTDLWMEEWCNIWNCPYSTQQVKLFHKFITHPAPCKYLDYIAKSSILIENLLELNLI